MEKKSLLWHLDFYLNSSETIIGKFIELFLFITNIFACYLFVESVQYFENLPGWIIWADYILVSIFMVEYLIRILASDNKLKYIISFYGIIDLLSIFPSFIQVRSLAFIRGFKVFRILRFFRFLENEIFFFGKIHRVQLLAVKTLFVILTILFISSGFILIAEINLSNSYINNFSDAFYYCVTTLSTVGFGDVVTITQTGRILTVIMILMGAVLIPWQAGKLIRVLIMEERNKRNISCQQCGLKGHDFDASHCKACGHIIFQNYEGEV